MSAVADRRIVTYSRGMKQRIGLAQTLVANPRLIVLDEPTANLDPQGAAAVCDIIRRIRARGGTVLLSSHQLNHIENICDRVAFLNRGHLVTWGAMDELAPQCPDGALVVESLPKSCLPELRIWLEERGARIHEGPISSRSRLERVFMAAVSSDPPDGAAIP